MPAALRSPSARFPASPPARTLLAPGEPCGRRPAPFAGPGPAAPLRGWAAPRRALSLPSARCHCNSPVDSWAEAERAFAKGEGGGRRARAPLPGGAAPAGGAVARSPPAKPLVRRSHPTRGCSGGLRGLARRRASTGCVPLGLQGRPPTPGWAPLFVRITRHFPCVAVAAAFGGSGSHRPRGTGPKKGRERRAPRPAARPGRRPPPHTAAFRALAPRPSRLDICISHDCGQSGLVSPEADGFCLRGKGVAGGACAAVADSNRGFYCCSLFPPPSLLFSPSLSFFFRPGWGCVGGEEERETEDCIYLLRSWNLLSARLAKLLHLFQSCKKKKNINSLFWHFFFFFALKLPS